MESKLLNGNAEEQPVNYEPSFWWVHNAQTLIQQFAMIYGLLLSWLILLVDKWRSDERENVEGWKGAGERKRKRQRKKNRGRDKMKEEERKSERWMEWKEKQWIQIWFWLIYWNFICRFSDSHILVLVRVQYSRTTNTLNRWYLMIWNVIFPSLWLLHGII